MEGTPLNYCRFLNRQLQNALKSGASRRLEGVFRPFICGDPHRDRAHPQELGPSLGVAREECKRRCPGKFGLPAASAGPTKSEKDEP